MRIIIASMPVLALAAILSATAQHRIDNAARVAAKENSEALPECMAIINRGQAKRAASANRGSIQL